MPKHQCALERPMCPTCQCPGSCKAPGKQTTANPTQFLNSTPPMHANRAWHSSTGPCDQRPMQMPCLPAAHWLQLCKGLPCTGVLPASASISGIVFCRLFSATVKADLAVLLCAATVRRSNDRVQSRCCRRKRRWRCSQIPAQKRMR
jgi:hypothetical protein